MYTCVCWLCIYRFIHICIHIFYISINKVEYNLIKLDKGNSLSQRYIWLLRIVHAVPSRWSLPVGVSGARPTTNHINLPPRTHKHAVWLASACTGIWFDWLALPSTLEKLNFSQLPKRATEAKRRDGTTMQFGKALRHPIQSEWEASPLQHVTKPRGRTVTVLNWAYTSTTYLRSLFCAFVKSFELLYSQLCVTAKPKSPKA